MPRNRPGAKNIAAVILGASTFPAYKTLEPSEAFAASAAAFEDYLRSKLNIPDSHILPLFDDSLQPGQQLSRINSFIRKLVADSPDVSDFIFYYCGHGAYLSEDEYVLALKCTDAESKEATVFKVSYLVNIIANLTREKRNLVVLDACYSGAALGEFINMSEHNAAETVSQQFFNAVPNPEDEDADATDEPGGAVLFCAAGPKKWAKTPLEAKYTMFSGALKAALEEGDPKGGPDVTVRRLAQLVDNKIRRTFGTAAVKPQVHVQGGGDLLESPYFPNPAFGSPLTATNGEDPKDFEQFVVRFPEAKEAANAKRQLDRASSSGRLLSRSPTPSASATAVNVKLNSAPIGVPAAHVGHKMMRLGLARVWSVLGALLAIYSTGTWISLQGGKSFVDIPGLDGRAPVTSAYQAVLIIGVLLSALCVVGIEHIRTTETARDPLLPIVAIGDVGPHGLHTWSMRFYQSFFFFSFVILPVLSLYLLNTSLVQRGILWHEGDPALGSILLKNGYTLIAGTENQDREEKACRNYIKRPQGFLWLSNMRCDPVKANQLKPFSDTGKGLREDADSAPPSCVRSLAIRNANSNSCKNARDISELCEENERRCRGIQWFPLGSPLLLAIATVSGWFMFGLFAIVLWRRGWRRRCALFRSPAES